MKPSLPSISSVGCKYNNIIATYSKAIFKSSSNKEYIVKVYIATNFETMILCYYSTWYCLSIINYVVVTIWAAKQSISKK